VRAARYLRLYAALARFGLARELAFRGNFVLNIIVEIIWLSILLVFYRTVFRQTSVVAGWTEMQYLFFVGCYFTLEGMFETLFLGNCSEFADLVRSGDLDFYLLQPIDEQFLLSCRNISWSSVPNVLLGAAIMGISLHQMGWLFDVGRVLMFIGMFVCGAAITYSFLLLLTSTSVWFKRNQSLYELWWLFTSLMRYPKEIYAGKWAGPLGWFFSFVVPILLVVNVPAEIMVKMVTNPTLIAFTALVAVVSLTISRRVFRLALQSYRSASS
jgi:ABC-2 type transport system permease protein